MKKYLEIFLLSSLALFLELLIIRLMGTEIRIFAYLSNYILLAVFLGTGLGMMLKKKITLEYSSIAFFAVLVVLVWKYIIRLPNLEFKIFSGITEMLSPLSESYIWLQVNTFSKTGIIIGIILTLGIFALIAFSFVPIGQQIGRKLNQAKSPLLGYSVNILGSILGMWVFNAFSYLGISPFFGLVLAMFFLFWLSETEKARTYALMFFLASVVLLIPKNSYQPYEKPVTFWSPYQKLTLSVIYGVKQKPSGWYLEVNNAGYMGLLDLSAKSLQEKKTFIDAVFIKHPQDKPYANQYDLPYYFKPQPDKLLIIGGGGGNDAAAAVRAKAKSVEVVEIDPVIIQLGRKYHPELPYSSPTVAVTVDDGRGYMERVKARKKYDLIIMGLADSHTVSSGLTNVQLDNYLYTEESLRLVKSLLKPDGVLFLTFEVTRPWIGTRIQQTMTEAFGFAPKVFEVRSEGAYGWGGIAFVTGKDRNTINNILAKNTDLASFVSRNVQDYRAVSPASINNLSDDWPYIYLSRPQLPTLHLIIGLLVILCLFMALRYTGNLSGLNWPMLFFGAGFMLYEFRTISKASLVFGNTWTTNLFIITGVMIFILLANFLTVAKKAPLRLSVILLFLSFLMQLFIPASFFNNFSGWQKYALSIPFFTVPHLFSAIIFAKFYLESRVKAPVLGSNLLGSVIGGFLEILSFLLGMQSLVYLTIALYGCGLLVAYKRR